MTRILRQNELDFMQLKPNNYYYMLFERENNDDDDGNDLIGFVEKDIFTVFFIGIIDSKKAESGFCLFSDVKPYKSFRSKITQYDVEPQFEIEPDNILLSKLQIRSSNESYEEFYEKHTSSAEIPHNPKSYAVSDFFFYGKGYDSTIKTGQLCLIDFEDIDNCRFIEKKSETNINFDDIFKIRDKLEKKIGVGPHNKVFSFLDPKKTHAGKRKIKSKNKTKKIKSKNKTKKIKSNKTKKIKSKNKIIYRNEKVKTQS